MSTLSIRALSRTCNGAKLYMSVVDTFAVTSNHLVGRNVNSVEKKINF